MPAGVTVFPMKRTENSAWYLCRAREQVADGRCDEIGRLLHRTNAEIDLMAILERSEDEAIRALAGSALIKLRDYYDACERVIARHEARGQWDDFRLKHRLLSGQALELSSLAGRQPDSPCSSFKARRLNLVLRPLKEEMEEVMGVPLSLIPEESLLSYSDVSMILRTYLDVCEGYVRRFYKGNPPVLPELPPNWAASLIRDQILTFCRERPKSILEIGAFLGYKDKKTTRKYLNPLLTRRRPGSISIRFWPRASSPASFPISPTAGTSVISPPATCSVSRPIPPVIPPVAKKKAVSQEE